MFPVLVSFVVIIFMYTQYVTVECYNALILLRYCEVKWFVLSPCPPPDDISAMMTVQRRRVKIVRTLLCCIVYFSIVHSDKHTSMSSSYC